MEEQEEREESPPTPKYNPDLHWNHFENRGVIRLARDLFFKEYAYERIFLVTGVPPSVFYGRSRYWNKIKNRIDEKYLTKLRAKVVSKDATDLMKKGTQILNLYFDRVIKRGTELDAKEAKLTSDILANIHRIKQLEEGKPTDISMYEKMTTEEAMAYLQEMQRQTSKNHEMSMFSEDVPEEEILKEFLNNDKDNGIH